MKSISGSCASSSVVPLRCGSGVGGWEGRGGGAIECTRNLSALASGTVRTSISRFLQIRRFPCL
jgi:hypothetical protein